MARIAVVEDDKAVRRELAMLLERNGYDVYVPVSFASIVEDVLKAVPDLVLLDLNLPNIDGTVVCRGIRAESSVPIIVVTSRSTEIDEVLSIGLGADDFISKPYSPHVLLARIEAALRRVSDVPINALLEYGDASLDLAKSQAVGPGGSVDLTNNELKILRCLMHSHGAIVSRSAIMQELWSTDSFIDDNTLTVNINRLRATLESIGLKDYLVTHRGQGYSVRQNNREQEEDSDQAHAADNREYEEDSDQAHAADQKASTDKSGRDLSEEFGDRE